jgi:hypothetical protein
LPPALNLAHALAGNLRVARQAFVRLGRHIAADPELIRAAAVCRQEIARAWELFRGLGMASACGACAAKYPGGCCFPKVALNYSREQILANLLFGMDLY